MSDAFAGLLEGLSEGFQTGHGFREDIKTRKRRRELEDRLAFLREQAEARAQAEEGRQVAAEGRQAATFGQQQEEYQRRRGLHEEVNKYLTTGAEGGPAYMGGFLKRPPLSPEATRAQAVGRELLQYGGREVDPDAALLVGSGEIPYQAIQPKRYYPTTREEYLQNYDRTAGRFRQPPRAAGRVTRAQAAAIVAKLDADYSVRNRFGTGIQTHYLSPPLRAQLIDKIVAGTFTEADLPPLPGQGGGGGRLPPSQLFPSPTGRPQERGLTDFLRGDSIQPSSLRGGAPAAPTAGGRPDINSVLDQYVNRSYAQDAVAGVDPKRVEAALQMYDQYTDDVTQQEFVTDLIDAEFTDAEIAAILRQIDFGP